MSTRRIARISETKRGRFALFDEEGFLFSVDGETLAKQGLEEGALLSEAELAALKDSSDTRRAKDRALRYLSRRAYGEEELYRKLCVHFDEHSAAAAVAAMRELSLLDDEAFALQKAEALAAQGKASADIRRRLRETGLSADVADAAVQRLDIDDAAAALALVRKSYLPKLRAGGRQNVMAALARRGFSHGAIRAAVQQAQEELNLAGQEDDGFSDLP